MISPRHLIFLSLAVALLSVASSKAQITIGSGDMPSTGNIIRVSNGQAFPGMNARLTGTNYNWDYSQLIPTSQTVDTFVSVFSTGLYAFQFGGNSSFALKSNAPPVSLAGALTIEYEYDFYKKSTASYIQTGFGAKMNGFPLPVPYSPKDTIYRFPLHYNDVASATSAFEITIPGLGYYGGDKTRTDTVDGWGTLTTPFGTFNVLRVKSVINEIDTIHYDAVPFGISFPRPVAIEYKWLALNQRIPLLQINTSGGLVSQIIYRDSIRLNPLGTIPVEKNKKSFHVFPNPSTGKITIDFILSNTAEVSVEVFNMTGEKLITDVVGKRTSGKQLIFINLEEEKYPPATYIIRVLLDGIHYFSQQVVKQAD